MKVRYLGPYPRVQIAATGQTADRGEAVDVPTQLGRELVKQSSWEKVTATKKKETEDG